MATAKAVKKAKRTAKPANPFGSPSKDEVFDLLIPEGAETGKIPASDNYIGKLISLTKETSKSSGNPMWTAVFTITKGDYKGMDFTLWLSLGSNALWKVADTLTALGVPWEPGKPLKFKLKDVLGTLVQMKIIDDKSQDGSRDISKLAAVLPHPDGAGTKSKTKGMVVPKTAPDDDDEDEDDDEEQPRKAKKRRAPEPDEDEDEDEDEDDEDQDEDEDEDEDGDEDEDEDEDEDDEDEKPAPKKRKKTTADEEWPEPPPSKPKSKRKPAEEDDVEFEDEDDDEEEEPVKKRRKATAPAPVAKKKKRRTSRL